MPEPQPSPSPSPSSNDTSPSPSPSNDHPAPPEEPLTVQTLSSPVQQGNQQCSVDPYTSVTGGHVAVVFLAPRWPSVGEGTPVSNPWGLAAAGQQPVHSSAPLAPRSAAAAPALADVLALPLASPFLHLQT